MANTNYYPKKRGRRRKEPRHYVWPILYGHLQEILECLTYHKGEGKDKECIKVRYWGTLQKLKDDCKRILNTIELYEDSEKEYNAGLNRR